MGIRIGGLYILIAVIYRFVFNVFSPMDCVRFCSYLCCDGLLPR